MRLFISSACYFRLSAAQNSSLEDPSPAGDAFYAAEKQK